MEIRMERLILKKLLTWKNSSYRKPLILKGVRQVGKTWILKEFGRRYYENTAYFNFDENEEYKQFFETTIYPFPLIVCKNYNKTNMIQCPRRKFRLRHISAPPYVSLIFVKCCINASDIPGACR